MYFLKNRAILHYHPFNYRIPILVPQLQVLKLGQSRCPQTCLSFAKETSFLKFCENACILQLLPFTLNKLSIFLCIWISFSQVFEAYTNERQRAFGFIFFICVLTFANRLFVSTIFASHSNLLFQIHPARLKKKNCLI